MSDPLPKCIIFAGPTLYDLAKSYDCRFPDIEWKPPVRRDDIYNLVNSHIIGNIVIVDGLFRQCLAVGHMEIRLALEKGWQVWGLSSLGAIRAYEMRHLGMKGFGKVYEQFLIYEDFRDDEVALLHGPEPYYQAYSEPLIHIRIGVNDLVNRALLPEKEANQLINQLANKWFGERTLTELKKMVLRISNQSEEIDAWIANFEKYRIKNQDLKNFLTLHPWNNL